MREIKFRVWNQTEQKMINSEDKLTGEFGRIRSVNIDLDGSSYIEEHISYEPSDVLDDKLVLLQYTGLNDVNGKEIYEGDIIKHLGLVGTVTWVNQYRVLGFRLKVEGSLFDVLNHSSSWSLEVVGNIYSNPELLKR